MGKAAFRLLKLQVAVVEFKCISSPELEKRAHQQSG